MGKTDSGRAGCPNAGIAAVRCPLPRTWEALESFLIAGAPTDKADKAFGVGESNLLRPEMLVVKGLVLPLLDEQ